MPLVNSTAIKRIEWSAGVLSIWFHSNPLKRYDYPNVPERLYREFLTATSKGTFYDENIRDKYADR